jgi:hypothetical protein
MPPGIIKLSSEVAHLLALSHTGTCSQKLCHVPDIINLILWDIL